MTSNQRRNWEMIRNTAWIVYCAAERVLQQNNYTSMDLEAVKSSIITLDKELVWGQNNKDDKEDS